MFAQRIRPFQHVSCAKSLPPCHYSITLASDAANMARGDAFLRLAPTERRNAQYYKITLSLFSCAHYEAGESKLSHLRGRVSVKTKKWTQSAIDDCFPLWIPEGLCFSMSKAWVTRAKYILFSLYFTLWKHVRTQRFYLVICLILFYFVTFILKAQQWY